MARKTILRCSLINTVHMAGCALNAGMFAGKWEARPAMVKMDILPGAQVMTGTAIGPKLPSVGILCSMTGKTIHGCAFIYTVDVTCCAGNTFMTACQLETRHTVIEVHILPIARVMTLGTIVPHLTVMHVGMTGRTIIRRILEIQILVAIRARHSDMFPHQREHRLRMIECDILPGRWLVTRAAVLSQCALMQIILFMARETIRRRAFENSIDMAFLTSDIRVGACQFKGGKIMVEVSRFPALRRMAGGAIRSQCPVMWIILYMTGNTILFHCPKVGQTVRIAMTILALNPDMFADQLELEIIVCKVLSQTVSAIMAIKARVAISQFMLDHEPLIDLTMTIDTG